jgi:hypothetical protein
MIMPHIVSLKKLKKFGGDRWWGNVNIIDGHGVNLTVISGAVQQQPPLYKGVRCVDMGPNVPCWCFMAVLLDAEGDVSRASVVFEAWQCWRCGLVCWPSD